MAIASGTCGTCSWEISDDGTLSIGAGTLANNTSSSSSFFPWTSYNEQIQLIQLIGTIICGENISHLFSMCRASLIQGLINLNTSNVTNMRYMFLGCENLQSLDLSSFDTSNVTKMSGMFSGCKNLQSLNLNNFNTSKVTEMTSMFQYCENLQSLDLSSFDTSNVTTLMEMFNTCKLLTSLDLNSFNTSNVAYMNGMFGFCESLTSLDLSNFNTSNVVYMNSMFNHCESLVTLDLSNFDTSNVKSMSCTFQSCSGLTSLDLSNFDTGNVIYMNGMFNFCESLTSLDLSNFNTNNVIDMSYMFQHCPSLISLNLSSFNTNNVTDMTAMFRYCESLTLLDLSNFDFSSTAKLGGFCYQCKLLQNINICISIKSDVILYQAFYNCTSLNSNIKILTNNETLEYVSSIFDNTIQPISIELIDDPAPQASIVTMWKNIVKDYSNVYIVTNNPTKPQITVIGERGKYENSIWTADDTEGNDLKISYQYILYNNTLPVGVTNSVSQISTSLSSDSNWTETKIDTNNIIYYKSNSNDTDSHNITITIKDAYNKTSTATVTIAGIYALLDLRAGGNGMAIGKVAEKNGLEIHFPTMIGEYLSTPLVDKYILTDDTEVVQNKEYWQYNSISETYIQVSNPVSEDLSTYYEKTQEIDLNKYQLVVGKYNEINDDAIFIVGNGDSTTPRNVMTIGKYQTDFYTQPDPTGGPQSFDMTFRQSDNNNSYIGSLTAWLNGTDNTIDIYAWNDGGTSYDYSNEINIGLDKAITLTSEQGNNTSTIQVNINNITMDANNISLDNNGDLTLASHSSPIGDIYEHTASDVSLTSTAAQTQNTGKTILSCTGEHIIPAGCWVGFVYVNFSAGASTVVGFNMSTSNTSATWSTQMRASEQNYGTRIRQPVTITIANDTAYYVRAWSREGCTVNTVTVRLMRIK